jgi:hypothetical protein
MRHRAVVILAGAILTLTGCAATPPHPPTVPVRGKVVFKNGKPLPQATVQFVPVSGADGYAAQGTTDDAGVFACATAFSNRDIEEGVVAGKYKVVVIPYPHRAKIDVKYASPVNTPLQVEVPPEGVADLKLVVEAKR